MKVTKIYSLEEWKFKGQYRDDMFQIKITKYSQGVKVLRAFRKHRVSCIYNIGDIRYYLDRYKKIYIVYNLNKDERINFDTSEASRIKVISIERFLENLGAWQLLKKL